MFLTVVTREKRLFSMVCGFLWIFNKAVRLLITRRSQVRVLSPQPCRVKITDFVIFTLFLLQQQGFCLAVFLMQGGEYTQSPRPGAHPPDSPGCTERRFPAAQYSRQSGNRSRSAACGSCPSPAPHTRRCGR